MTQKDLEIIKGFIDKKEPKRLEFEEAQAIVKLLFEIYRRCLNDARADQRSS